MAYMLVNSFWFFGIDQNLKNFEIELSCVLTFDSGEFCVRLSILLLVYHKSLIRKTFFVNYLIVLIQTIHIPTKTVLLNLKLKVINYIYLPQSKIISCNEISQFIIILCKGVLKPINY